MINKSFISGHVGKKPELKKTPNGKSWTMISVATTEEWKDKITGAKKEHTDWHQIKVWGKLAEAVAQWVVAGQYLEIEGKHKCDVVDKDGKREYYDYIQALEITFGPKPQSYWKEQEAKKPNVISVPGVPNLLEMMTTLQKLSATIAQLQAGTPPAVPPAPDAGMPQHLSSDEEAEYGRPYDEQTAAPSNGTAPALKAGM